MNTILISGRIVAIKGQEVQGNRVANILLQDYNGYQMLTFHASFWNKAADYLLKNINKGDSVELTGYIYQIRKNDKGPYLVIRNCQIESFTREERIAADDILGLQNEKMDDTKCLNS